MENRGNEQRIDHVQWDRRDDVLRRHHLDIDGDECRRHAAHRHEADGQHTLLAHPHELELRHGECLCIAEEHHLDGEERLELRCTREEREQLADPADDERQNAEIREDVKERHDEEDRQEPCREEVHLRHVDPVREHERDTDVRDVDQLREPARGGRNHIAANLERCQEPREHEVQREKRGNRAPLDLLAVSRGEHADAEEHHKAEQVDEEKHTKSSPPKDFLASTVRPCLFPRGHRQADGWAAPLFQW